MDESARSDCLHIYQPPKEPKMTLKGLVRQTIRRVDAVGKGIG